MLSYETGQSSLQFDHETFNFRQLLLDEIAAVAADESGAKLSSLEKIHEIPEIEHNVEKYRQVAFSVFRGAAFQKMFKAFAADLIDRHFTADALVQKTPTVRIQLPEAESTSYHSDGWYGHGPSVRSFWVPMVNVAAGNTLYMAGDIDESRALMKQIIDDRPNLHEINEMSRGICLPFDGGFGHILSFSSDMIHGAEKNTLGYTRVSFDFRIAPDPNDIGNKPRSNFFSRAELTGEQTQAADAGTTLTGITYSNRCNGVSAKSQLVLCSSFAEQNAINVNGNESEILPFGYLPVLRHYLSDGKADNNAVIVYGVEVFEKDKDLAGEILAMAKANNMHIVFCAQGLIYDPAGGDANAILDMI